jgi:hypothetical protein
MRPLLKRSLGAMAIILLVLVSGFAGGTYGFIQGYVHGIGDTSTRASMVTSTLRALRSGDVAKGIALLESDLDTLIMEHWATNQGDRPLLSRLVRSSDSYAVDRKLFARVAHYRGEYPSPAVVPEVRETITSHLKSFEGQ